MLNLTHMSLYLTPVTLPNALGQKRQCDAAKAAEDAEALAQGGRVAQAALLLYISRLQHDATNKMMRCIDDLAAALQDKMMALHAFKGQEAIRTTQLASRMHSLGTEGRVSGFCGYARHFGQGAPESSGQSSVTVILLREQTPESVQCDWDFATAPCRVWSPFV